MEGWIGLLKQYQRKHGNMRPGWLLRAIEYLDLYCIGAVYQNQIDFCAIESNHYFRHKLMYEPGITHSIEMIDESKLPEKAINILENIDQIKFGDKIPDTIDNNINGLLKQHQQRIQLMKKAYEELPEEAKRHQCVDPDLFTQQQQAINNITSQKIGRRRGQWFIDIQNVYDNINSIDSNYHQIESEPVPEMLHVLDQDVLQGVDETTSQIQYNDDFEL